MYEFINNLLKSVVIYFFYKEVSTEQDEVVVLDEIDSLKLLACCYKYQSEMDGLLKNIRSGITKRQHALEHSIALKKTWERKRKTIINELTEARKIWKQIDFPFH